MRDINREFSEGLITLNQATILEEEQLRHMSDETSVPLRDFISNPLYTTCRVAVTNDGDGCIFIIRTQTGAEHFFSVVDCTTQEGDHRYATVTQIMEQLGELRRVILL